MRYERSHSYRAMHNMTVINGLTGVVARLHDLVSFLPLLSTSSMAKGLEYILSTVRMVNLHMLCEPGNRQCCKLVWELDQTILY